MTCSNNAELIGKGVDMGTWDRIEYVKCTHGSQFCGVQPEVEPSGKVDNTAVNRLRFLCCKHYEGIVSEKVWRMRFLEFFFVL